MCAKKRNWSIACEGVLEPTRVHPLTAMFHFEFLRCSLLRFSLSLSLLSYLRKGSWQTGLWQSRRVAKRREARRQELTRVGMSSFLFSLLLLCSFTCVYSIMKEEADFCVVKPLRNFMFAKRLDRSVVETNREKTERDEKRYRRTDRETERSKMHVTFYPREPCVVSPFFCCDEEGANGHKNIGRRMSKRSTRTKLPVRRNCNTVLLNIIPNSIEIKLCKYCEELLVQFLRLCSLNTVPVLWTAVHSISKISFKISRVFTTKGLQKMLG